MRSIAHLSIRKDKTYQVNGDSMGTESYKLRVNFAV